MPDELKEPKTYTIELPENKKAAGKKLDVDDVRKRFGQASGGLAGLFNGPKEDEPKEEDEEKKVEDEPKEEEDVKEKEKKDPVEGEDETPKDDDVDPEVAKREERVRKILNIDPKKAKTKAKSAKVVEPPPRSEVSLKEVTEAATKAAVTAIKDSEKKATDDGEWHEDFRENAHVLDKMVALYPDKYKGLKSKITRFVEAEAAYKSKWQKDNPEEEFDEDAKEHSAFYNKNYPDIPDSDLDAARKAIEDEKVEKIVESKIRERMTPFERKEKERERQERVARVEGELKSDSREIVLALAEAVDLDLPKDFDKSHIDTIEEEYPVHADIMDRAYNQGLEAMKLWRALSTELIPYDGRNPSHQMMLDEIKNLDAAIQESGHTQRDGKRYLPWADYMGKPEAEKSRYWTFTDRDMLSWITQGIADAARKQFSRRKSKLKDLPDTKVPVRKASQKEPDEEKPQDERRQVVKSGSEVGERGGVGLGDRVSIPKQSAGIQGLLRGLTGG